MIVCPLVSGNLVVVLKKSANAMVALQDIQRSREMVDRAFAYLASLQGSS